MRRVDEAITAYQADIAICHETGDRHGEGMTLGNLGQTLRAAGRDREAAAAFRETCDPDGERLRCKAVRKSQCGQPG